MGEGKEDEGGGRDGDEREEEGEGMEMGGREGMEMGGREEEGWWVVKNMSWVQSALLKVLSASCLLQ